MLVLAITNLTCFILFGSHSHNITNHHMNTRINHYLYIFWLPATDKGRRLSQSTTKMTNQRIAQLSVKVRLAFVPDSNSSTQSFLGQLLTRLLTKLLMHSPISTLTQSLSHSICLQLQVVSHVRRKPITDQTLAEHGIKPKTKLKGSKATKAIKALLKEARGRWINSCASMLSPRMCTQHPFCCCRCCCCCFCCWRLGLCRGEVFFVSTLLASSNSDSISEFSTFPKVCSCLLPTQTPV